MNLIYLLNLVILNLYSNGILNFFNLLLLLLYLWLLLFLCLLFQTGWQFIVAIAITAFSSTYFELQLFHKTWRGHCFFTLLLSSLLAREITRLVLFNNLYTFFLFFFYLLWFSIYIISFCFSIINLSLLLYLSSILGIIIIIIPAYW